MKILKVKVAYGRTFNLGNYESLRKDVELEAEICENESEGDVIKALQKEAKFYVENMEAW